MIRPFMGGAEERAATAQGLTCYDSQHYEHYEHHVRGSLTCRREMLSTQPVMESSFEHGRMCRFKGK